MILSWWTRKWYKILQGDITFKGDITIEGELKTESGQIAKTTRITGATTLDETHHVVFCDTDGSAFTVTLPAGVEGTEYRIINVGTSNNDVTIDADGTAETVLGAATQDVSDGEILDMHYNATEGWW